MHDRHPIGDLRHDAHVMGHQQNADPLVVGQLAQQVEDLRLDRHVEGRRRLVGHEQPRLARQCRGNHHALPLAAGQLVRVGAQPSLCFGNSDRAQKLQRPLARRLTADGLVRQDRFDKLALHREERVQARHRILEHRADVASEADVAMRVARRKWLAFDQDRAGCNASGLLDETQHRIAHGRLASPRFADEGMDFAGVDRERSAFDRNEGSSIGKRVFDTQVADVEDRGRSARHIAHQRPRSFGLKRSRSQSPTTFTASTSSTSSSAGNSAIHQIPEKTNSLPIRISVPSEG